MNTPPAFQFYVKDWLSDTRVSLMSLEAQGLYLRLLCHQWEGGGLPDLEEKLARLSGEDRRKFRRLWSQVRPCFAKSREDGLLRNERLEAQRAEQLARHEALSEAGRKGGKSTSQANSQAQARLNPASASASAVQKERETRAEEEHIGQQVCELWRDLKLPTPRGFDWGQAAIKLTTLTEHFSDEEILEGPRRISTTPDLAWAGARGPAYLCETTRSGAKVLEVVLAWKDPQSATDSRKRQPVDVDRVAAELEQEWATAEERKKEARHAKHA